MMVEPPKKKADESFGSTAKRYCRMVHDLVPVQAKPFVEKATPFVITAADAFEAALPHIIAFYVKVMDFYEKTKPYRLDLLIPSLVGLIMCFFGGSFMTLIAAVEAYRLVGWESSYKCLLDLYRDLEAVVHANAKDDAVDDNNDGIPDVQQIDTKQLVTRKTLLFLKTVDPHRFTAAITGLQAGFLAVVATLKVQFAKAITLGNSIAEYVEVPVLRYALPLIEGALPNEYKRWAEPVLRYTIRSSAVSIAWTIQRVISAFHSAIAGGIMASRNVIEYLNEMKYIEFDHTKSYLDEAVGYGLAVVGLWFQLSMGFSLPFILRLFLFPFSFMEWFLMWMVNRM